MNAVNFRATAGLLAALWIGGTTPEVNASLLAHWSFDESGGATAHDSASGLDGQLSPSGSSFVSGGVSGNALLLQKSAAGYVSMGPVLPLSGSDFTISLWVKTAPGEATSNLVPLSRHAAGTENGYFVAINKSSIYGRANKAMFFEGMAADSPVSSTSVNDGSWHHITCIYQQGGNKSIYVDGAPAESRSASSSIVTFGAPFMIGAYLQDGAIVPAFQGWIDDVQVYDQAASDSGVDFLYQHPGQTLDALPPNQVPVISTISNQVVERDQPTSVLGFDVADAETPAAGLEVTAWSSNPTLVPNSAIILGGSGEHRTVFVQPAPFQTGTTTITLQVRDSGGGTATTSFVLEVKETEQAPRISSIPDVTLNIYEALIFPFTVSDFQSGSEDLRVSASAPVGPSGGSLHLELLGRGRERYLRVYKPDGYLNLHPTVTLTVTDPDGNSSQGSFRIDFVNRDNFYPEITPVTDQVIFQNGASGPIPLRVQDVETTPEGLLIFPYSEDPEVVPPSGIRIEGTGGTRTMTIIPEPGASGAAEIWLQIVDGYGGVNYQSFYVEVRQEDGKPHTLPMMTEIAAQQTARNQATPAIPIQIGDAETAPDNLVLAAFSDNPFLVPAGNITFSGSGSSRSMVIEPATDRTGSAVIGVTVTDSDGQSITRLVDVVVQWPGTAPVLSAIPDQSTGRNQAISGIPLEVSDAETPAELLIVRATSSNTDLVPQANLTISGTGGSRQLAIAPASDRVGTSTITVTVTDGDGRSTSRTFVVQVSIPLSPPTISAIPDQWTERNASIVGIPFVVNDADTDPLLLTIQVMTSNALLLPQQNILVGGSGQNRVLSLVPVLNRTGQATVTLTVTDRDGQVAQETFVFTVVSNGTAPQISQISNQTAYFDQTIGPLSFSVADAETASGDLVVTAESSNSGLFGTEGIEIQNLGAGMRSIRLTPRHHALGSTVITIRVRDADGMTASASFVATISVPPGSLTITSIGDQSVQQNRSLGPLPVTIRDALYPFEELAVALSSSESSVVRASDLHLGGNGSDRVLTVTPSPGALGRTEIRIAVTTPDGRVASESFLVDVVMGNPPVIAAIPDQTFVNDGGAIRIPIEVSDEESAAEALEVSVSLSNPGLFSETSVNGGSDGLGRELFMIPAPNQTGTSGVTLTVTDPDGQTAQASFVMTIRIVRGPLVLSRIPDQILKESTPALVPLTISDQGVPLNSIRLTAESSRPDLLPASNILFGGENGERTVLLIPSGNGAGTLTVTVTAVDDLFLVTSQSFQVVIEGTKSAPTISAIAGMTVSKGQPVEPVAFSVSDKETLLDQLEVSAVSSNPALVPSSNLRISGSGSARILNIEPGPTQAGSATITVRVTDGDGMTAETDFVLKVAGVLVPGDFNGDGKADLILADDDGLVGAWFMDGDRRISGSPFTPGSIGAAPWRIVGAGDFNRDGQSDLLFGHTDGWLAVWLMSGTESTGAALLEPARVSDPAWHVVAVGDADRDGDSDLILQHEQGDLAIWWMDGLRLEKGELLDPSQTGTPLWRVAGGGRFFEGSALDLFFQHEDGTLAVWRMEGARRLDGAFLSPNRPVDPSWRVVATLDMDGDGWTDIVFRHRTEGTLAVWYLKERVKVREKLLTPWTAGGTWKIVGPK